MPERTASGRAARADRLHTRSGVGLALAGGGPLGGIYEVGALVALTDTLDGIDFNELDAYVGVSSGGFVAAALANGISPAQMYRLFIDDGVDAALTPQIFLRPAFGEFARRAASLPRLFARATMQYLRDPFQRGAMESFATLVARDSDRDVRQRVGRRLPAPPVRRAGAHRRFPQAPAQALPRRHESRFRRVGDLRRRWARPRADLEGDRGLRRAARAVPAGGDRRRALRRRRAQQDAARVRRARRGRGAAAVRQSAGALRLEPRRPGATM